jgi:hypothetical protein
LRARDFLLSSHFPEEEGMAKKAKAGAKKKTAKKPAKKR